MTMIAGFSASHFSRCSPPARPKRGAKGTIELRYGSPYPQTHPFSQADAAWMKYVEAQSAGA